MQSEELAVPWWGWLVIAAIVVVFSILATIVVVFLFAVLPALAGGCSVQGEINAFLTGGYCR